MPSCAAIRSASSSAKACSGMGPSLIARCSAYFPQRTSSSWPNASEASPSASAGQRGFMANMPPGGPGSLPPGARRPFSDAALDGYLGTYAGERQPVPSSPMAGRRRC
ncbi:hypothetical protein PLESTF_001768700 [Pleodorina starrii]|nr:hypothetical protein PLESTF_001768700 [Pleodorina starrii]